MNSDIGFKNQFVKLHVLTEKEQNLFVTVNKDTEYN